MLNGDHNPSSSWRLRFGLGRLRGAWYGFGYLTIVVLVLSASMGIHKNANDLPFQTWQDDAKIVVISTAVYFATFLLPLPLFVVITNRAPASGAGRYAWLAVTTVAYGIVCSVLPFHHYTPATVEPFTYVFVLCVALGIIYEFHRRAAAGAEELLRTQIDCVRLDSEVQRASLQHLRAQIEPHFLFNTLATIRRLAQTDRPAATKMTADLVRYFMVALPRLKDAESTLGSEAELAAAYLDIHRVRMGPRMSYAISIPDELASARIPTMMLLTLVENAIKHGLAPIVEGGFVGITARRNKDTLEIEVADTGRGMTTQQGHGVGLANARARLALLYGAAASVALARGKPRGVVATISLPARWAA